MGFVVLRIGNFFHCIFKEVMIIVSNDFLVVGVVSFPSLEESNRGWPTR